MDGGERKSDTTCAPVQLEEKLKDTVDPDFRDEVSFQAERDLFLG